MRKKTMQIKKYVHCLTYTSILITSLNYAFNTETTAPTKADPAFVFVVNTAYSIENKSTVGRYSKCICLVFGPTLDKNGVRVNDYDEVCKLINYDHDHIPTFEVRNMKTLTDVQDVAELSKKTYISFFVTPEDAEPLSKLIAKMRGTSEQKADTEVKN